MKVIIIGCDRLGAELAGRLSDHDNEVIVVDKDADAFVRLPRNFRGRVHEGDALNRDVLVRAGIEEAAVVLALTRSDTTNYILGQAAKEIFNVQQVIVLNNDPACQYVCEHMGLQAISSAIWGAEQLEEMIGQVGMEPVLTMGGGEIEVYSLRVPASWAGESIDALVTEKGSQVLVSLTRAGKSMIPDEHTLLQEDDVLHIAADHAGIENLHSKLEVLHAGGK